MVKLDGIVAGGEAGKFDNYASGLRILDAKGHRFGFGIIGLLAEKLCPYLSLGRTNAFDLECQNQTILFGAFRAVDGV